MKKGIHHVGFTSGHFEETVRLYQQGLGFTVKHIWGRDKRVYMMEIGDNSFVEVPEVSTTTKATLICVTRVRFLPMGHSFPCFHLWMTAPSLDYRI